jgi:hypothetical protein
MKNDEYARRRAVAIIKNNYSRVRISKDIMEVYVTICKWIDGSRTAPERFKIYFSKKFKKSITYFFKE